MAFQPYLQTRRPNPLARFKTRSAKLGLTAAIAAVGALPLWMVLGARALLEPNGFWQELALGVVALWLLGVLQLVLGVVALLLIIAVWLA